MDTTKTINHISLCAGYGGIDLGLKRAIPSLRTVLFSEIESYAIANLVSKMEKGLLDAAPVWSNLKTLPWDGFLGKVDIISGGFPCQPFSSAGKRAGDEDPRHLFPYILDGIRRCRPSVVFLENVAGILSSKLAGDHWRDPAGTPVLLHVFRELERVGYKSTAGIFSASEVGAVHQRKRVFILSQLDDGSSNGLKHCIANRDEVDQAEGHTTSGGSCVELSDSNTSRLGASRGSGMHNERQEGDEFMACCIPSRPGQPQFPWEPPRVVANSNKQRRGGGSNGDEGELCREVQTTRSCASEVGNPSSQGLADTGGSGCLDEKGRVPEAEGCEPTPSIEQSSSPCGAEELGNTGHEQSQGWDGFKEGQQLAEWGVPRGESTPCCGASDESPQVGNSTGGNVTGDQHHLRQGSGEHRGAGRGQHQGGGQTQRPMGLHDHGSPDWVDISRVSGLGDSELAEIYEWMVKTDNRTDSLRLLGNGVYPDTATLAFRTLWAELNP